MCIKSVSQVIYLICTPKNPNYNSLDLVDFWAFLSKPTRLLGYGWSRVLQTSVFVFSFKGIKGKWNYQLHVLKTLTSFMHSALQKIHHSLTASGKMVFTQERIDMC